MVEGCNGALTARRCPATAGGQSIAGGACRRRLAEAEHELVGVAAYGLVEDLERVVVLRAAQGVAFAVEDEAGRLHLPRAGSATARATTTGIAPLCRSDTPACAGGARVSSAKASSASAHADSSAGSPRDSNMQRMTYSSNPPTDKAPIVRRNRRRHPSLLAPQRSMTGGATATACAGKTAVVRPTEFACPPTALYNVRRRPAPLARRLRPAASMRR